ncbi:MAG: prohibitin family protein [Bacteroidota bacterium]|nr:prohibitin family protein [Bacteroidota bacterium]
MQNRRLAIIGVVAFGIFLLVLILSNSIFYTIEATERGVLFRRFSGGLDKENIIQPGFGIKAPWNILYVYDVSENTADEKMDILDKNGLYINVDVTVRYFPLYDQIGYLHERFNTNYTQKLVIPEVRSAVRQVMGRYTAEEIYSTKRAEVEATIKSETGEVLEENFINMSALLIRSINLPEQIKNSIENKLQQEQEALAYQYRLDKERSEAERKKIAAEGEATANKIINSSLTENLLRMRGIETTLKLSESPNSKLILIGGGGDGLPLILNPD